MRARGWAWGVVLALAPACIVPAPSGEPAPSAAPPVTLANGASFENKVELVRATFRPGRPSPGQSVRAQLVFRVTEAIPDDYVIFVHLEDGAGRVERRNIDHAPLGGMRPTRTWRPGELLTDEFSFDVPPGVTQLLNIWVGFWHPSRDARLKVTNPERVRTDGMNRVLAAQLQISGV